MSDNIYNNDYILLCRDAKRGIEAAVDTYYSNFINANGKLTISLDLLKKYAEGIKELAYAGNGYAELLYAVGINNKIFDDKYPFYWELSAALEGNHVAEDCIASIYSNKDSQRYDMKLAFEWYKKAADGGIAIAQLIVGKMYLKGEVVEQDYQNAAYYYEKAALQENTEAQEDIKNNPKVQYGMGLLYYYGDEYDFDKCVQYLEKCALHKYDQECLHMLAFIYMREADQYLVSAAYYIMALLGPDMQTMEKDLYEELADNYHRGDILYYIGMGFYDPETIAQWIEEYDTVYELFKEHGPGKSYYGSAMNFFSEGAKCGNSRCMFYMGIFYCRGFGVTENNKLAAEWLVKAHKNGNGAALKLIKDIPALAGYAKDLL